MLEIGALTDVAVQGGKATMTAHLATPSSAVHEKVKSTLTRTAQEAGAREVEVTIDVQVPTREVMGDDPIPGVKNIVLVMSGKGGVGKSTTAVNLALALKRMGLRVGLLDADIYGPSIPTMMGVHGHPPTREDKKILPLERFGVKMMSIGFLLEDDKQAVIWRGPMLHSALQQFLTDVSWGELDYLVLDLPPGTGDVALTMAQKLKVTGAVIVTTPQEVALQDVYKCVSMCSKLSLPILGVIENMSYFVDSAGVRQELFGAGGGQKVAEFASAPLLGQIPLEPPVREWGDKGMPIVQSVPDSSAARAFTEIAEHLANKIASVHFERAGGTRIPATKAPTRLRILR
ncbi:MAG: Mrp/NBP35 family ATP-binding protein [Myxococcota bacterium]|nr:Mrp/NBP35 family ATP-binding protein [Myxococcota bacterium]